MLLALTGCAGPGVSSRCGYAWTGQLICETRFHHPGKPATFAVYAVENGRMVPLISAESSSILSPVTSILGAGVP